MKQHKQYIEWLHKFADGTISDAEAAEFRASFRTLPADQREALEAEYENIWPAPSANRIYSEVRLVDMRQRIRQWDGGDETPLVHRVHFLRTAWFRYAAVLVLIAGTAIYLYLNDRPQKEITKKQFPIKQPDLLPGGNRALLTLSDGRTIVLDSTANGPLASQGGIDIVKLDAGSLAYRGNGADVGNGMNTVRTPKGGQYQITLADGTKVWLNAASSIRFPTGFGKNRKVTITGEVYMEVAADKSKPFIVNAHDMEVQVLGTSFNINAYSDEPAIKTTLLDGSIKVLKKTQPRSDIILKPGQQVIFGEKIAINEAVDVEQTISWKNGVFNFNGATLEEFMRQIARWYDLTIIYQGAIPHKIFKGKIGRDLKLSQIMKLLTQFNIKYQLSGNTITIEPQ